ncbi:MAG TPA: biotin--[acetyl-CoA-carboxylase] ligase [Thermoflexales bacterium]|nr:biotin--[acetyl-CoA-carboxylase] ligase [Thermoflexales bacterium]HRA55401.1 biotin--[acetyl-CoA-carboxylase] ligase [Thermoflexales bacterium]
MQFDLRRFEEVTSTMDVARELAEAGAPEGVCVVAGAQTSGRGRMGRTWFSPPGTALYMSLLLRPTFLPTARGGWLAMLSAVAVRGGAQAMLDTAGCPTADLALKWPNDVLLGGRKLAGILIESTFAGDGLERVVVGIGLNVNTRFDQAPEEVRLRATSLREAVGDALDLDQVLAALLAALEARYEALRATLASPQPEYARHLATLGTRVRLLGGSNVIEGRAFGVTDDGALRLETASGPVDVSFGDIG